MCSHFLFDNTGKKKRYFLSFFSKNTQKNGVFMLNLSELNDIFVEYSVSEYQFYSLILYTAKKFYDGKKNILFFDYDKGLFAYEKANNTVGYFKPSKRSFLDFQRCLISELKAIRDKKQNTNHIMRRELIEKIGTRCVRGVVREIADNGVYFTMYINNKPIKQFILFVRFKDFFSHDAIKVGHNFWLSIKKVVMRGQSSFYITATRKNSRVIQAEFEDIFSAYARKVLDSDKGKELTENDFRYRIVKVSMQKREIVVYYSNKSLSSFFRFLGKVFYQRINFKLFSRSV